MDAPSRREDLVGHQALGGIVISPGGLQGGQDDPHCPSSVGMRTGCKGRYMDYSQGMMLK